MLEVWSFDFGELRKSQGKVKKTFKVSNAGTDKLVISNIRTSCACVAASIKVGEEKSPFFATAGAASGWQAIIDPGKAGELEVSVDLKHPSVKTGKLIRELSIFSNDPLYPETILMIEGALKD